MSCRLIRASILVSAWLLSLIWINPLLAQTAQKPLHVFNGSDGSAPTSLIVAQNGSIYGSASMGGASLGQGYCYDNSGNDVGCGRIFLLNSDGSITSIYDFTGGTDGGWPTGIVQGPDGLLYGTTTIGGTISDSNACPIGCGTIFAISPSSPPSSPLTPVYTFDGSNGLAFPNPLVMGVATDGKTPLFYGSALPCSGFCNGDGGLFSFSPTTHTFTLLPNTFPGTTPLANPNSLLQANDDTLYGTTQLGGPNTATCLSPDGCGGVFSYNLQSSSESDLCAFDSSTSGPNAVRTANSSSAETDPARSINTIVQQPGGKFPALGGQPWTFATAPTVLSEASDGSILGTTPWVCMGGYKDYDYELEPASDCGTNSAVPSTIFRCTPNSQGTSGTLGTIYAFGAKGDGSGSTSGIYAASDGNYYGLSGVGSGGSEMFSVASDKYSQYEPLDSSYIPTWMVQAQDGSFYGTSLTGGTLPNGASGSGSGAIFQVTSTPALNPPVQLTPANAQVALGSPTTLTWTVPNAWSLTSRLCYAFVQKGASGADPGDWSGMVSGTFSNGVFSGTASITPTQTGTYTYALTCGGVTSGFATWQVVIEPLTVKTTSLATATQEQPYSATLQAGGGVGPYTWSAAPNALPAGLALSSGGIISGTPTVSGSFTFTVSVTDKESTPATKTGSITLTINSDAPAVMLTASPNSNVVYGQTITLTAAATPFPPASAGYIWSISDGTKALVTGAASNASNGYSMTTPATVGQHTYTATFSSSTTGWASGTSNSVSLSVAQAPTTTTLTATVQNPNLNGSVTFTATVSSTAGGGTPTGSVQFLSGTTILTTASLSGNTAIYTTTSLPAGANTITAAYSGDTNYTGSTSSPVSITVTAPAYSLAANPPSLTVKAGATATTTITLTPVGGYNGTINLTCSTTAPYTSCSFTPTSLTANGSNTAVSSTFTFSTNVSTTAGMKTQDRLGRPPGPTTLSAGLLAGVILLFGMRRRISHARVLRLFAFVLLLFATSFLASLTACGGGGSSNSSNSGGGSSGSGNTSVTPAGNYTVNISASAGSGSAQTLNISVTVN